MVVVLVEPSCQGIAAFGLGRRGSLSMAVSGAFPDKFKEVHPEYGTPAFGTWVIGAAAIIWYVVGSWISQNFLFDSLSALSIVVAFDYGLTGPAGRRSRSSRPTVPSPPVGASPRSSSAADGAHRCPSPSPPRPRPTGTAESRRVRRTSHSASTSSSASSSRPTRSAGRGRRPRWPLAAGTHPPEGPRRGRRPHSRGLRRAARSGPARASPPDRARTRRQDREWSSSCGSTSLH